MSDIIKVAMTAWLASKYDVKQISPVGPGPCSKSVTPVKLQIEANVSIQCDIST